MTPSTILNHSPFANEPVLEVGILQGTEISIVFKAPYQLIGEDNTLSAPVAEQLILTVSAGKISYNGLLYDQLLFIPVNPSEASFGINNVRIGIHFHWERTENQYFEGALKCIVSEGQLIAINQLPVETYLMSVISSEMNAKASFELLKAHAVISRSWILFQLMKKGQPTQPAGKTGHEYLSEEGPVRIRWYDRADHQLFDVCADDHCQRYQGITRMNNSQAKEAVLQTRGQVLWAEEGICDARFSKCCGGMLETFEHCWEEEPKSYLVSKRDWLEHDLTPSFTPDLRKEEQAEVWITGQPKSFCHTTDSAILSQILNDYDQETPDFYRWKVTYTKSELSRLVEEKAGLGLGDIQALIPLERGYSGRIVRLKLVGSRRTAVIGKELEIRKTLSPTHLYSSAFVVRSSQNQYTLLGAGWGHGVGLCQIGAAVMASNGYPYDRILAHYYPGSRLRPLYP